MNWEAALLVVVSLVVCAELYSMRETIRDLRDKITELNDRLSRKRIEELRKEDEQ
jgi:cell division protein ZapA (FtsZ GTPase activity inhibitor)